MSHQNSSYTTTPVVDQSNYARAIGNSFETLRDTFVSKSGALLLGLLVFIVIANLFSNKKTQLTSARWIGMREKLAGIREAKRQLKSKNPFDVCLYIGSPPKWQTKGIMPELITLLTGYPPTLYVPGGNGGFQITGKPESGKTFSVINPLLASAIEQGFPIILLDYKADEQGKGGQMSYIATLAARYGYKVNVFAPGREYSCVINPVEHFLADESDDTAAKVLAEVFHANMKDTKASGDAFFTPAGRRLIQALIQLAKSTEYPDLAMAFSILQLQKLPERLAKAARENSPFLPVSVKVHFMQLIQTSGATKTSSGIIAGAADVLTDFMSQSILRSVVGKTNVSLILNSKEILVFQSDIFRQDVINPLIAGIFNLVINKNFSFQRKVPLVVSMDEFPTFYFPKAHTWPNEHRSKLFVGIYGYQSEAQIREKYGAEKADILQNGLRTRTWFCTGSIETAKKYSEYLGDTEVIITNKSRSRSYGGNSSGNQTTSQQLIKRPLMLNNDFTQFKKGECIFMNAAYQGKERAYLPWHLRRIQIPQADIKRERECEEIWDKELLPSLTARERKRADVIDMQTALMKRTQLAEQLFPLPEEDEKADATKGIALGLGHTSPDF